MPVPLFLHVGICPQFSLSLSLPLPPSLPSASVVRTPFSWSTMTTDWLRSLSSIFCVQMPVVFSICSSRRMPSRGPRVPISGETVKVARCSSRYTGPSSGDSAGRAVGSGRPTVQMKSAGGTAQVGGQYRSGRRTVQLRSADSTGQVGGQHRSGRRAVLVKSADSTDEVDGQYRSGQRAVQVRSAGSTGQVSGQYRSGQRTEQVRSASSTGQVGGQHRSVRREVQDRPTSSTGQVGEQYRPGGQLIQLHICAGTSHGSVGMYSQERTMCVTPRSVILWSAVEQERTHSGTKTVQVSIDVIHPDCMSNKHGC